MLLKNTESIPCLLRRNVPSFSFADNYQLSSICRMLRPLIYLESAVLGIEIKRPRSDEDRPMTKDL
jgi:hypothetical protein